MQEQLLIILVGLACSIATCPLDYPGSYIAYHLQPDEHIVVDGRLDESAWHAVGWSDPFMDIQGPTFPEPRFPTMMKMRWDEQFLYLGAYLVETQVWANETKHDAVVFHDNDFEFFCDPDASTHHYKELEINAINTVWDLMLNRPYLDGGSANNSWDMLGFMQSAVYVDGPINNPNAGPDRYWTVELALPFKFYVQECFVARAPPRAFDLWRINFSRVEWRVHVVNGHFEKLPPFEPDNWVWQSQAAINMHLPERWGYLQFSTDSVNTTKPYIDPQFDQRRALAEVYYAEHKFMAVNGYYTSDVTLLQLPSWVLDGSCNTMLPNVTLPDNWHFAATVQLQPSAAATAGHIRDDRLTWFDPFKPV